MWNGSFLNSLFSIWPTSSNTEHIVVLLFHGQSSMDMDLSQELFAALARKPLYIGVADTRTYKVYRIILLNIDFLILFVVCLMLNAIY